MTFNHLEEYKDLVDRVLRNEVLGKPWLLVSLVFCSSFYTGCCYGMSWTLIFFSFISDFIWILFLFLFWMMKRHVTLQSHDMLHDVML